MEAQAVKPKAKIFAFANGSDSFGVYCVAIDEEGHGLAGHICSHAGFGPHDMGVTSNWKHDKYAEKFPDGFEVIWVDDPPNHPECWAAIEKQKARAAALPQEAEQQ